MNAKLIEKENAIKQMYNILNMETTFDFNENCDNTLNLLQKEFEKVAYENYTLLFSLVNYLNFIPDKIKYKINDAARKSENFELLYMEISKLKDLFINDPIFSDFVEKVFSYVAKSIFNDGNIYSINKDLYRKKYNEYKILINVLIYGIINGFSNSDKVYESSDFILNLFLLCAWVEKNMKKPLEKLNEEECIVIVGLIYGMSVEEMVNPKFYAHFDNTDKIYEILNIIPKKLYVDNMLQAIFRLAFINPMLWHQDDHESFVNSIMKISSKT
nr:MAG TPA: hypothetical protein [Caudoviricetes sp.]